MISSYINVNALDIEFISSSNPIMSFEDWANKYELYFDVEELDAMDGNLHLGTHYIKMYHNESKLAVAYGDGIMGAIINLAKYCIGREWFLGNNEVQIKAPMKFKGI